MKKLLIIGYTWPEPKTTGAGVRMLQLIQLFLKNDFEITFATTAEKSIYSENLQALGISEKHIKLNDSGFDEFLKELQPDFVLFDRFYTEEQFGWRDAEVCPKSVRILDTEDLHFLRNARQISLKQEKEVNPLESDMAKREIASIYRSDISLIISEEEMAILQERFKIDSALLHYIPFLLDNNFEISKNTPSFEERNHFIFLGNYKHQPNVDAVLELKKEIWPLVSKQIPEAEMHCYGAYAPDKIKQLHSPKERFFVNGWVEDAEEKISNARVMLVPLRFGAGMKGKLLQAMQCGTPSITTTLGAEGISGTLPWSGFVTDTHEDFADKAVLLYNNKEIWEASKQHGFTILKERFMASNFEGNFFKKINSVSETLEVHRQNNFIGSLLAHHTLQSTKYLSKWIEEKNK